MNMREAINLWVNRDMNAIPQSVVEKLIEYSDYCDITEITPPSIDDRVYVFDSAEYGYISNYTTDEEGSDVYVIALDNGEEITIDYGYIFGIDGCGYDFYEAHWIPLYKARGLRWHDDEE